MADGFNWANGQGTSALVEHLRKETMHLGHRVAADGIERLQANIEVNTPVETTHLRESYKSTDVEYKAEMFNGMLVYCWTGKVYTEVEYAPHVEYGTGLWGPDHAKYKIAPKKPGGVLRFTPYARGAGGDVILDVQNGVSKGRPVYARFVMHPGSPGQAMFRIGAILTEAQIHQWSRAALEEWRMRVMTA